MTVKWSTDLPDADGFWFMDSPTASVVVFEVDMEPWVEGSKRAAVIAEDGSLLFFADQASHGTRWAGPIEMPL